VETLKAKVLSDVGVKFRQFKSKLTTDYICDERKKENPCTKYASLDEETWQQFVQIRQTENGRLISLLYLNIVYINVLLNFECYDRRFGTKQKSIRHIMIPHTYCPVVVISC